MITKVLNLKKDGIKETQKDKFRKMARLLRDCRNMPFAFYGNSSGGVNCGFYFEWSNDNYTPEDIIEYINYNRNNKTNTNKCINKVADTVIKFIDLVSKQDSSGKYTIYKF